MWFLVGCGQGDVVDLPLWPASASPEPAGPTVDLFDQDAAASTDILVVVDPAVAPEVAGALPAMIATLSDTDWRIGIVSTASAGVLAGVIDAETTEFPTLSDVGPSDPLHALYLALQPGTNPGFPSAEALQLVIVSATDEQTDGLISVPEMVELWDSFRASTWPDAELSVIAPPDATVLPGLADGVVGDVTEPLDGPLAEIGLYAFGLETEFFLSRHPLVETLGVTVHDPSGAHLELDPGEWVYDADRNSVQLLGYVPRSGASVELTYEPER